MLVPNMLVDQSSKLGQGEKVDVFEAVLLQNAHDGSFRLLAAHTLDLSIAGHLLNLRNRLIPHLLGKGIAAVISLEGTEAIIQIGRCLG